MGNNHNHRVKKMCQPVKAESVAPIKVQSEIGVFYTGKDADMKTVSVGSDSTFALIIIFLGGGYLLSGLVRHFTKRREPWESNRQLTDIRYEDTECSPLVKKVSSKPQTKKCIPMSVNS